MSRPGIPSFKDKLVNRTVIVKASLFHPCFLGNHHRLRSPGFCLVSNEMNAAFRQVTGGAIANMDAPSVYLPFSKLERLISSQPKAATSSA